MKSCQLIECRHPQWAALHEWRAGVRDGPVSGRECENHLQFPVTVEVIFQNILVRGPLRRRAPLGGNFPFNVVSQTHCYTSAFLPVITAINLLAPLLVTVKPDVRQVSFLVQHDLIAFDLLGDQFRLSVSVGDVWRSCTTVVDYLPLSVLALPLLATRAYRDPVLFCSLHQRMGSKQA